MTSRLFLPAITVALAVAAVGCGKTNKINTPSPTTPPASGAVEMKLKWTPGERIVQELEMKQNVLSALPGLPAPMKTDMTIGEKVSLTVVSADPDGGHKLEMQFLAFRMAINVNGKTINYDSAESSAGGTTNPMAAVFSKMVGAKIQFFLDASNHVQRLEGLDELMERIAASGTSAAVLRGVLNEDNFKQMLNSSVYLPPKPVQPGDTWPVVIKSPTGVFGTMTMNYTATFKGWDRHGKRNCALLEFAGSIEIEPAANAPSGFAMSVHNGKSSGMMWFDPDLGTIIESDANEDMMMIMTVPKNQRAAQGSAAETQTITNQVTQAINIKADSVN